jgi:hypothetical protein
MKKRTLRKYKDDTKHRGPPVSVYDRVASIQG